MAVPLSTNAVKLYSSASTSYVKLHVARDGTRTTLGNRPHIAVLDEADRLFSDDFEKSIDAIE